METPESYFIFSDTKIPKLGTNDKIYRTSEGKYIPHTELFQEANLLTISNKTNQNPITNPRVRVESNYSAYTYTEEFDNTTYLNDTATNTSGWGQGNIRAGFGGFYNIFDDGDPPAVTTGVELLSSSIAQSIACYTGKGFVQKATVYANQTVFPNTSIHYQISTDENIWIPINLNETYTFTSSHYHGLYWRATLEVEDLRGISPQIDSLRIKFDIFYDLDPPQINLVNVQNDTVISPRTVIVVSFSDYLLDQSWFNWNDNNNLTLTNPWTITCPTNEKYHWLTIYVNDSLSHLTTRRYRFYMNHPPVVELYSPSNNSVLLPGLAIEFLITDPTLINVWYQWDNQDNASLTAPYAVNTVNTTGTHVLLVGACDSWSLITLKSFSFYILGCASIQTTQHPPSTAYSRGSFIYSFSITNSEIIPLILTLIVFGTDDDVLGGNVSKIVLNPGENRTIELQIRPKHASLHQLEIYLFYENLIYHYFIIKFNVAPQWMSPTFLLQLLITVIFVVIMSCTSFYYIRKQLVIRKLFWEKQTQLTRLKDQLIISNMERAIEKEIEASGTEDPSSRPLGFHQYLQLSEPLDREALKRQFYSLRNQIQNGDLRNFQRLSELLTQTEVILNEFDKNIQ